MRIKTNNSLFILHEVNGTYGFTVPFSLLPSEDAVVQLVKHYLGKVNAAVD